MNRQVSHPLYIEHDHPINLNIGTIQGGHWPSSVPVECSFVCRLSYEPGVAYKEVRGRVENCIMQAAQHHPVLKKSPPQIEYYGFQAEGSTIEKESELVQALGHAHQKLTGEEIQSGAGTGLTDMRYFNLYANTPATCYGPRGSNIHNADEYVELSSILTGAKTLALFILDWCGGNII